MLAFTYTAPGKFSLTQKQKPSLLSGKDAVIRMTLASPCTSDVHIRRGAVPRAKVGVTVGHEGVGIVESVGSAVRNIKPGDRVAVNCETFCGECFFCRRGYVNNCTDTLGGWALGCRIDGLLAEYARIPFADNALTPVPDGVSDEQALFTGDLLSTGYWAADIADIVEGCCALVIGAGPAGLCAAMCAALKKPRAVIVCERDNARLRRAAERFPAFLFCTPEELPSVLRRNAEHGGADSVIEAAGSRESFRLAWESARPNATVAVVAMYEEAQTLPLPDMYGKNLTFRTGGVDGCRCGEILAHIAAGELDASPLITHAFPFADMENAFAFFEQRRENVLKTAIRF